MSGLTGRIAFALATAAVAALAAVYVGGHLRDAGAPLQPPVKAQSTLPFSAGGSVHAATVTPVTSTYAS